MIAVLSVYSIIVIVIVIVILILIVIIIIICVYFPKDILALLGTEIYTLFCGNSTFFARIENHFSYSNISNNRISTLICFLKKPPDTLFF